MFRFTIRLSVILLLFFGIVVSEDSRHNQDDHFHDPPHMKYSREANVDSLYSSAIHTPKRHNLRTESPEQLWLEVFGAVLLISLAPFLFLCILPDLNKHQGLLKILLAFAAGSLLGDAFLHLIPHAIDAGRDSSHAHEGDHHHHHHDHQHHDDSHQSGHNHKHHMVVGLSLVGGIFIFLFIEKLLRLLSRPGPHPNHCHHHTHSIAAASSVQSVPNANATVESFGKKNKKGVGKSGGTGDDASSQKRDKKAQKSKTVSDFRAAGYLNLVADFVHNFTDGLAIGASFLVSRSVGLVTTMTVLFHELPHEIGDYAILIQAGCSARKAMFLQLVTAVGAALGASLSLLVAGVGPSSINDYLHLSHFNQELVLSCVLPFTAGGFIYIAMTSVLPDLLNSETGGPKPVPNGFLKRLAQAFTEIISLIAGVGMMAAMGAME